MLQCRYINPIRFAFLTLLVLLILIPLQAMAQEAGTIVVPVGSWAQHLSEVVGPVLLAVLMWLMRKLPASVVDILKTMKAEQLLTRAVDYGVNAVAGAAKDKVLSVHVGNAVVAQSVQYVIDNAPGWLVRWLGGQEAIAAKIIARLNVEESASVDTFAGTPRLISSR